jgi:hypothetical protein
MSHARSLENAVIVLDQILSLEEAAPLLRLADAQRLDVSMSRRSGTSSLISLVIRFREDWGANELAVILAAIQAAAGSDVDAYARSIAEAAKELMGQFSAE